LLLLDLGCGNGALTAKFSSHVNEILGIDRSDYLIKIANKHFKKSHIDFECSNLENILKHNFIKNFNKCLIYGVSSFLEDEIIYSICKEFLGKKNNRLMFGNVRELKYADHFYTKDVDPSELNDTKTSMGKWRTRDWFSKLAKDLGTEIYFSKMPKGFYASKYYFDVVIRMK
jgi:SAM-dependent methyltransferase